MKFEDIKVGQYFTTSGFNGLWLKTTGDAEYLCIRNLIGDESFVAMSTPPSNQNLILCDENGKKIEPPPVHFDTLKVGEFFMIFKNGSCIFEKINPPSFNNRLVCVDIQDRRCCTLEYSENKVYRCDINGNLL